MKSVCICGSFRFNEDMTKLGSLLEDRGLDCSIPVPFRLRNKISPSEFVDEWYQMSGKEKIEQSRKAELDHLEKIQKSDIVYVVCNNGYIGTGVAFEIGFAYALEKRVFSSEFIQDHVIMSFVEEVLDPDSLVALLTEAE